MVTVLNHPLITHKLAIMRDEKTCTKDFSQQLDEIASLMAYEVSRDLPVKDVEVKTPMAVCKTQMLAKDVILVPILRAGMGMTQGIRNLIPTAKVGFIGLYRNEETLEPVEYFAKFPKNLDDAIVMVLDPMLATGGSAAAAIDFIKARGGKKIIFMCLIAAPEGIEVLQKAHPDVDIFIAAKDEGLNENAYILPGLGDAGDRLYGTK